MRPADPIQTVETVTTLHPLTKRALDSDLSRALKFGVFACVPASAALYLLGQDAPTIFRACVALVGFSFLLMALPELFQMCAKNVRGIVAILEAVAEFVTRRDLNQSGRVGDYVQTEYRIIPSNIKANGIPVQMGQDSVTVRVPDLKAVILDGNLLRSHWLGEKDANPVAPFKDKQNARQYYDALCKVLDDARLTKRGENNSRLLVNSPTLTWATLGLE